MCVCVCVRFDKWVKGEDRRDCLAACGVTG